MYDGTARADLVARVSVYIGIASLTWGCWAMYQMLNSSIPFDFGKYADILFLWARHDGRGAGDGTGPALDVRSPLAVRQGGF
ncbi:hypothetical protein [Frigidibacter sp.]|uniref:hypothetical protein n=1 Tax=Frigidibacter sp. TaxID=2586418 RepID=UPI002735FBFF|nr:hypothetical protein [Frigidibacter sp.]MDP3339234.1 hypothetical protein [Frigidibacter sp.]